MQNKGMLKETSRWLKNQAQDKGKFLLIILLKCNKWPLVTQEEQNKEQEMDHHPDIHNIGVLLVQDKVDHQVNHKEDHHQVIHSIQAIDLQAKAVLLHKATQMLHKGKDHHLKEDNQLEIYLVTQIL